MEFLCVLGGCLHDGPESEASNKELEGKSKKKELADWAVHCKVNVSAGRGGHGQSTASRVLGSPSGRKVISLPPQ